MARGYFLRTDGLVILGVMALALAAVLFSFVYITYFSFIGRSVVAAIFSIALFVAIWAILYGLLIIAGAMHDVRTARRIHSQRLPDQYREHIVAKPPVTRRTPRKLSVAAKKARKKTRKKPVRTKARRPLKKRTATRRTPRKRRR
ncbi:MAG: hypothetical protein KKA90_03350 [Nanoarchaeota archaeon]|nr:hypothetical protein [Nanoarchaeota archaeon]